MFEKVEKIWDENKGVICFVGGICLVVVGSKYLKHIKKLNALDKSVKNGSVSLLTKVVNPRFSDDMPIPEIKAALDKIEGAMYTDALVAWVDGHKYIYIR